jgi:hypothetical protein
VWVERFWCGWGVFCCCLFVGFVWFVVCGCLVFVVFGVFGFNLPESIANKTRVFKTLRAYISGQNILTFSKYWGYDPDFISDGLFSRGYDYGSFPNPRTVMVGLQLGL